MCQADNMQLGVSFGVRPHELRFLDSLIMKLIQNTAAEPHGLSMHKLKQKRQQTNKQTAIIVVGPQLILRHVVSDGFSPHQPRPLRGGVGE